MIFLVKKKYSKTEKFSTKYNFNIILFTNCNLVYQTKETITHILRIVRNFYL